MLGMILSLSFALMLAVILLAAASHKLRSPHRFARQLEAYELLPQRAIGPVARLLPLLEVAVAVCLLVPGVRSFAGAAAAALLLLYTAAIGFNLWRGRSEIDCGCSGPGLERPLAPSLLVRNAVLVVMALAIAASAASAPLHGAAFLLIAAFVASGLILYTATEGLLANQPRLKSFSGR